MEQKNSAYNAIQLFNPLQYLSQFSITLDFLPRSIESISKVNTRIYDPALRESAYESISQRLDDAYKALVNNVKHGISPKFGVENVDTLVDDAIDYALTNSKSVKTLPGSFGTGKRK